MQLMEYIVKLAMLAYTRLGVERSTPTENLRSSYDFIVVGGGTAGAIVASKLSENVAVNVLLLDSGGSSSEYTDIPYTYLYSFPDLTASALKCFGADQPASGACWAGSSNYKNYCQVCESRILGGGSTINGFTYVRGTKYDYDSWVAAGASGWSYDELLPSMMALETFDRYSPDRGTSGPVHVTEGSGDFFNLQDTWLKAGAELKYPINPDTNGRNPIGFGKTQNNVYNGARQTMDNVFLKQQQKVRPNLHIKMFSHVTKVLFNADNRAIGVEYVKTGDFKAKYNAFASKEVVLSAGAIQTPHILINSGVGPPDQINFLKIRQVATLWGVGQNLQDHPKLHMVQFSVDNLPSRFNHSTPDFEDHVTWVESRSGPLATGSSSGVAFLPTSNSNSAPDIQFALSGAMHATVVLNAPQSRGQVRVRTNNPYDGSDPYVELNLLNTTTDIQNLVEGAKILKNVFSSNAFLAIGAKPSYTHEFCKAYPLYSDDYFYCLVKDATVTGFHYAGTAKIGRPSDSKAVVNERLKVYNVKGLRVADASVMPTIVRANPNAAVMLIGWKAAEMIKQDYGI